MKWVLLPGLDGTGRLFDPFVENLSDRDFEVIELNSAGKLNYQELAEYITSKITGDMLLLIAESFSGPLALLLAEKLGIRIKGLVLCATFIRSPVTPLISFLPLSIIFKVSPPNTLVKRYLLGDDDNKLTPDFYSVISKVKSNLLASRVRSIASLVSDRLPNLKIPILYLRAANDRLVKLKSLELIKIKYPHVESIEIEGPHLLLQTNPIRCIQHVVRFENSLLD